MNEDCQLVASISHSGRYLCCAVARGDLMLGIDLEEAIPRRDVQGIADNWFGREEAAYMADRSKGEAERIFYSLWTAKEAYLKALGVGIGGGLRSLQASFDAQGIASYHLQKPDQLRWRLFAYGHSEWHLAVTVGSDNERYLPVQIDWHSGAGLLGGEGADDGLPSALGQPALYRL